MARGRNKQVIIPPVERMITRNRGKRQIVIPPSIQKRSYTSNGIKKKENYSKKKPWEESDDDIDYKVEMFSPSEDEMEADDVDGDEYTPDDSFDADEDFPIIQMSKFIDDDDTIFCPWSEEEEYESLVLPNGSKDLFFPHGSLMDLIRIYETIINYHRIIQISPFVFEDFLAAIRSPEQTLLIGDIHIALLKCILRDDDENQTQFAVTETSVSYQLICQLMDATTYAEVLRQYIDSDPRFSKEILDIITNNYPFVSIEDKIKVLLWLCDQFFETSTFRTVIKTDGKIQHNEHCRECGKAGGELISCRNCDAVYHGTCNSSAEKGNWICEICDMHSISGVADSLFPGEKFGRPSWRRLPIGYDRDGRIYWFLIRRIIVEDLSNDTVQFYSTLPAIFDLISALDPVKFEARLCRNIFKLLPVIERHCRITQELTESRRHEKAEKEQVTESYLNIENFFRMSYITWNVDNCAEKFIDFNEEFIDVPKEEIPQRLKFKLLNFLGFEKAELRGVYWTGGRCFNELLDYRQEFVKNLNLDPNINFIPMNDLFREDVRNTFRLGLSDQYYRNYENLYETNEYAKNPVQRAKERDRRKYMNTRFSIDEPFQWKASKGRTICDIEPLALKFLKINLRLFMEKIPDELYHREWSTYKQQFYEKLTLSSKDMNYKELAQILLQFEAALRKPIFMNAWWNSLGHIRLYRYTSTDRELKQQADKQKAKEDRELIMADSSDSEIVWVHQTKMKNASKTLFRIKGEQYRLNGKGELGGWEWVSSMYTRDIEYAEKPPLGISYSTPPSEIKDNPSTKAYRLDKLIKKLTVWRESQIEELKMLSDLSYNCYSPSCGKSTATVDGKNLKCYSCFCPNNNDDKHMKNETDVNTADVVKAFDPVKRKLFNLQIQNSSFENTHGLGIPFPFPKPFDYVHPKTKRKHLFVLPKCYARKLAKCGGLKPIHLPGFNRNTKTNFTVWNYPCPRPVFDNCWRFMTQCVSSVHSLALQMRILFCGIRWADFEPNWYDTNDFRYLIPYTEYNELRSVISHKEFPPDGYYERYKLRVELFAEDDDGIPDTAPGDVVIKKEDAPVVSIVSKTVKPTRKSDRRKSKRNNITYQLRNDTQRKIVERWIDGVDLKVFEIQRYWKYAKENVNLKPPTPPLIKKEITENSKSVEKQMIKKEELPSLLTSRKRPIKHENSDGEPVHKKPIIVTQPVPKRVSLPIARQGTSPNILRYPPPYSPQTVFMVRNPNGGRRIVRILRSGIYQSSTSASSLCQPQNRIQYTVAPQTSVMDNPPTLRPMIKTTPVIRVPAVRSIRQSTPCTSSITYKPKQNCYINEIEQSNGNFNNTQ